MKYLAVDVGGTSTRAAVVVEDGTCEGYAKAGRGNPTSSDTSTAIEAIVGAAQAAMDRAGCKPDDVAVGVIGIAGAGGATGAALLRDIIAAGLPERLTLEADHLAAYFSGTLAADGYALVAGTGAAAIRVKGGRIDATCDGLGWLLGDGGSGFWIGHRAVLAATSALDHRGSSTILVDRVLAELGIARTEERLDGRESSLAEAVYAVYRMRPVEIARFAPLVFDAAALGDDVARQIVADAADALTTTLATVVVEQVVGPLVLGGSILSHQRSVADPVAQSFHAAGRAGDGPGVITVSDGLPGAVVLALRRGGLSVDDPTFDRVRASLARSRDLPFSAT